MKRDGLFVHQFKVTESLSLDFVVLTVKKWCKGIFRMVHVDKEHNSVSLTLCVARKA